MEGGSGASAVLRTRLEIDDAFQKGGIFKNGRFTVGRVTAFLLLSLARASKVSCANEPLGRLHQMGFQVVMLS
jgi:hypothetical protein